MNRILRIAGAALALAGLLTAAGASAAEGKAALSGVVNINTASAEQLALLPGIGAARAEALIAERSARGGFEKLEELLEVKGIGEAGLARLRPHVVLEGETTARRE